MKRDNCSEPTCPTDAELRLFGGGELTAADVSRVERCVMKCGECLAALSEFDDVTDAFVASVRSSVPLDTCSPDQRARAVQIANAAINNIELRRSTEAD